MKKTRFSVTKIISSLKKQDAGISIDELFREYGISSATFYNWKRKYERLEVNEVNHLKVLEEVDAKLKKMFAEVSMENYALKDLITKKL